jgi:hypothetical protein
MGANLTDLIVALISLPSKMYQTLLMIQYLNMLHCSLSEN